MRREPTYTSAHALDDLGGKPDEKELDRLKKHYPTYYLVHRAQLLQGMFDGSSNEELVLDKLTVFGLDATIAKQAKGGHARWVVAKVRKTVIRLLYLRYRLDEGMTRRQADQQLFKRFEFSDRSSIRKATHSPLLDGCSNL
jgi:hypothetical protein